MKINELGMVAREGLEPRPATKTQNLRLLSDATADIADANAAARYKSDTNFWGVA